MHLSSLFGSKVISNEDEQQKNIMEHRPQKFQMDLSESAQSFVSAQPVATSVAFHLNPLLGEQSGISKIQQKTQDEKIEFKVLERMQEIQEEAYKKAYALGIEDGKSEAIKTKSVEIEQRLQAIDELLKNFETIKQELCQTNEAMIVKILFHIAEKIALTSIQEDAKRIEPILNRVLDGLREEESFNIRLNPVDAEHLKNLLQSSQREWEYLKKARLVEQPDMHAGGCIIETNYGIVDARIEERVSKVWTAISEKSPKLKESLGE